ncbi:MAG TPA: DUF2877 domain-containing protein [Azospirillum sp.]|nr:DUF2877 domain-containing protein [Azospirillum sp.]
MHEATILQARSGDAAFIASIRQAQFRGVVHSVFDKAVNLQCAASGDLYTLMADGMDDGPNTLVVEVPNFQAIGVVAGDAAATDGALSIRGKVTVALTHAAEWRMAPPVPACGHDTLRVRLTSARAHIERYGSRGGMIPAPDGPAVSRVTSEMLQRAATQLLEALEHGDTAAALTHARRLIGLGPGLTPSGDDFLVGLMAALSAAGPLAPPYQDFCASVVLMSKANTNAISHAAIKMAAQGKVRDSVARLTSELLGKHQGQFRPALDDALRIGSSSGTDIAWGLVCGLEAALTTGEHHHGSQDRH